MNHPPAGAGYKACGHRRSRRFGTSCCFTAGQFLKEPFHAVERYLTDQSIVPRVANEGDTWPSRIQPRTIGQHTQDLQHEPLNPARPWVRGRILEEILDIDPYGAISRSGTHCTCIHVRAHSDGLRRAGVDTILTGASLYGPGPTAPQSFYQYWRTLSYPAGPSGARSLQLPPRHRLLPADVPHWPEIASSLRLSQ